MAKFQIHNKSNPNEWNDAPAIQELKDLFEALGGEDTTITVNSATWRKKPVDKRLIVDIKNAVSSVFEPSERASNVVMVLERHDLI